MLLLFSSPECNLQLVFYGKLMLFVFGQTNTCMLYVVFVIASFFGETTAATNFGKCNIILFPKSFPEKTRQENFISVSDSCLVGRVEFFSHMFGSRGLESYFCSYQLKTNLKNNSNCLFGPTIG